MQDPPARAPESRTWRVKPDERWLWGLLAALALFAYTYRLGRIPPGLFVDELSVAHNARAINRTGADQYGAHLPLFFRSLDDYKSPIHVYSVALSQRVLGVSAVSLRLPSVLFALAMAATMYLLFRLLLDSSPLARWLALFCLVTPEIFTYGRHALSEASGMPFFFVLALLALYRFHRSARWLDAALAGAALGVYAYTYTTSRLMAPLAVLLAAGSFALDARTRRKVPALVGAAALVALPMAIFILLHPGTLDNRFRHLWVFYDHPSLGVALGRMAAHYAEHVSPEFLFRTGQTNNLRHNAGGGGLLPVWLAGPFLLGIYYLWRERKNAFFRILLGLLILAPIPVALCEFELPHATRMLHLVPLALVVGALGVLYFKQIVPPPLALIAAMLAFVLIEEGAFMKNYFVDYPPQAQAWFDSGSGEALRLAFAARHADEPVFAPREFFAAQGIAFDYWGDLDPVKRREGGLEGLNIRPLGGVYPPGALVILPGGGRPVGPAQLLGISPRYGKREPLWSVYRMEGARPAGVRILD